MVSRLIGDAASAGGYFGQNACVPVKRVNGSRADSIADSEFASAIFETPEIAIDPEFVERLVSARVNADDRIHLHGDTTVTRVSPGPEHVTLEIDQARGRAVEQYDHAVNASWEDLPAIDATAGVDPLGAWSFRVKHFLRVRARQAVGHLPSATIVLGAFGDVVSYGKDEVFLSWYPAGRLGIAHSLKPPLWPIPLCEPEASAVRSGIFEALLQIMPSLSCLSADIALSRVQGGIIYALGDTDVDDPASRLHERYSVGPRSFGRYHTVNTGKYTLAPLFAKQTADRITGESCGQ